MLTRTNFTLLLLTATLLSGCAARGGTPRPFPAAKKTPEAATPAEPSTPVPAGNTAAAPPAATPAETAGRTQPQLEIPERADEPGFLDAVVHTALMYLGTPYRNGGSDPAGFDCSGLVQYVFARHGEVLPREVREQFQRGRTVDLDEVAAGDLVFFETVSRGASHVGIALGDGRFVHAPSSRGVVRVEPYTATYWAKRFVGARRLAETPLASATLPGAIRVSR